METAVVSGRRLFGSSKMYGQRGQLLKMYLPFDLRGLPWSFKISARSGISVNGIAFPLVQLTHLTRETASGLLPIVTQDSKSDRHRRYDQGRIWPTPRASNPAGSRPNGKGGKVLSEEVLIEEGLRKRGENIEALKDTSESSSEKRPRGSLNPTWVEWLMGFPTGWTDLSS
jgi:hypothetical protein